MEDLKDEVVVITGAARGMGKLHAVNFAREGSRVVATDVDEKELDKTVNEIEGMGFSVSSYVLDVSSRDACFSLVDKVESEVGPIDILINNAAVVECYEVLEHSEYSVRRMTDVNYLGQVWMMQAAVPGMVSRGSGHVVNMCSVTGKASAAKGAFYSATKHALIAVTDAIRQELRGSGVGFTIINPGYVSTGMFEGARVPFITSWQDPQKVADAVVEAVKKNRAEVCIPRINVRLAALSRAMCWPKFTDFYFHVLGVDKSGDTWCKDPERPF
jgi:short-subunit dehydrogenase